MPRRERRDYCVAVEDDGLTTCDVGAWVEEKYRRVGMYCELFATGMKAKWGTRVYIDQFAGPGHSRTRGTDRILLGSPLIALTLPDPFDRYIFCESDPEALSALRRRVARRSPSADVRFVPGDVNEAVQDVLREIPQHGVGHTVLSFCFVDPFSVRVSFDTIRRLADGRAIDFLILLALGMDANRNMSRYIKEESTRIDEFLGAGDWRGRWEIARHRGENFMYFLAVEYAAAMGRIGYLPTTPAEMYPVRSDLKNLPLYYLAYFSKDPLGKKFWKEVLKHSSDQYGLSL